jgi:ATP-dependent DNA helicase RecQ
VRPRSFDRPELRFNIIKTQPSEAETAISGFVRSLPSRFNVPVGDFFRPRENRTYSGLVFCPHANGDFGVERVRRELATSLGTEPGMFSGSAPNGFEGDWEHVRRRFAADFKANKSPLLVSTKAFGMGIDKPNIRYVAHYGIPGSIEGYYQEVGRAGRDGRPAECGLVLVEYDEARARRLLSEDVDLEEARATHDGLSRRDADDITRQLFFHFNAFRGIDRELDAINEVIDQIGDLGNRHTVEVAMAPDSASFRSNDETPVLTRESQDRALHRLVVLGVVRDYLVEWGARIYPVDSADIDSAGVAEHLLAYVRRSQPGRVEGVRQSLGAVADLPLRECVLRCAKALIEFVYDTVERSRRRSLREMWLAARESRDDEAFRGRLLDYLSQGAIAPALERLVDQEAFSYDEWTAALAELGAPEDAGELRGDSARLLSSYPDHPGLLLARGLSEAVDPRGNLEEFISNLDASLVSAQERYRVSTDEEARLGHWLLELCETLRSGAMAAAMVVLERRELALDDVRHHQTAELEASQGDAGVRVLALASGIDRLNGLLREVQVSIEEAQNE